MSLFFVAHIICACSPSLPSQAPDSELTVLTVNLHTYQELQTAGTDDSDLTGDLARERIERYEPIFDRIAAGIEELDPDIICFQEVGEWADRARDLPESIEFGATDTNMVHQILSRLDDTHYYYTMDWSHYGWRVWMDGSAILSKYPIAHSDSRFISSPGTGRYESWRSRNAVMARIEVPVIGDAAVYSVHAGWWDDPVEPSRDQLRRLLDWVRDPGATAPTIILCGDFNAPADGPAYRFMTTGTGFSDQYALANPSGMFDATIGGGAHGWESSNTGQRVDYILVNDGAPLEVMRSRHVFTESDFGRISDHVGIYAEFRMAPD
jgi:maltose 6'-phosphate phosphatase